MREREPLTSIICNSQARSKPFRSAFAEPPALERRRLPIARRFRGLTRLLPCARETPPSVGLSRLQWPGCREPSGPDERYSIHRGEKKFLEFRENARLLICRSLLSPLTTFAPLSLRPLKRQARTR